MFFHTKALPIRPRVEHPDAVLGSRVQELLGGRCGAMTGAMQALMQAWNCRGPGKYRQLLLDIGTEKLGHVEVLAAAVGELLHGTAPQAGAPVRQAAAHPGTQHLLHSGLGAVLGDSAGRAWSAEGIVATGNLLADLRADVALASQWRLSAARLHHFTHDRGVRELLGFLIARSGAHQNQFLAAIEEVFADGLEEPIVPGAFPRELEAPGLGEKYWGFSADGPGRDAGREGRWAKGEMPDGRGRFEYASQWAAMGVKGGGPSGGGGNGVGHGGGHAAFEPPPPDPRMMMTDGSHRPQPPLGIRLRTRERPPIGALMRGEVERGFPDGDGSPGRDGER